MFVWFFFFGFFFYSLLLKSLSAFVCLFVLAVDCGPPQPLRHGTLSGNSTVYPNIVTLACDVGFTLRGTPLLKCQANGTWSGTDGVCEGPLIFCAYF